MGESTGDCELLQLYSAKEQQMATAGGHARGRQEHAEETYRAGDREWAWERRWVVRWQKQPDINSCSPKSLFRNGPGEKSKGKGVALDRRAFSDYPMAGYA